jgi:hypothetical protein
MNRAAPLESKTPRICVHARLSFFWVMQFLTQVTSMLGSNHFERCRTTALEAFPQWKHGRGE